MKIVLYVLQDVSINVRKRIVKIFREICVNHPDFPKVSEMCARMLWHVSDEEGVKVFSYSCYTPKFVCFWFKCSQIDLLHFLCHTSYCILYIISSGHPTFKKHNKMRNVKKRWM